MAEAPDPTIYIYAKRQAWPLYLDDRYSQDGVLLLATMFECQSRLEPRKCELIAQLRRNYFAR